MEVDEKKIGVGVVVVLACLFNVVGIIGMGICFFFIWSNNLIDVLGAGLGFICGAILIGSGLISIAVVTGKAPAEIE